MRSLLSILVIGLVASTAMADSEWAIVGPGGVDLYQPLADETFVVEVYYTSSTEPIAGFDSFITVPAGFTIEAWDDGGSGGALVRNFWDGVSTSGGGFGGGGPINPNGWALDPLIAATWDAGEQINFYNGVAQDGAIASNGFVGYLEITAPSDPALIGGAVTISDVEIYDPTAFQPIAGDNLGAPLLLPEPASALLLLAGLPLLRRRR